MCASKNGPCKELGGLYPALREFTGEAADFLDRPADELFAIWRFVFFGVIILASWRTVVIMA